MLICICRLRRPPFNSISVPRVNESQSLLQRPMLTNTPASPRVRSSFDRLHRFSKSGILRSRYCWTCCEHRDVVQLSPSLDMDKVTLTEALYLLKGRVSSNAAAHLVKDENLQNSDLEPGKYEGGFKLWECAVDLAQHLCKEYSLDKLITSKTDPNFDLVGKKVLELGCGQGLPGIVPLLAGADVHFQDFNQEVLTTLTSQNVTANRQRLPKSRRPVSARYFGGDWGSLSDFMASENLGGSYDIILSAETIYNVDTQQQLFDCIKQAIKPPTGVAYIAAKTYYFGVGGGTTSFKKLLKRDGMLEVHTVATIDQGDGNKREILKLKFADHIIPYFL